MEVSGQLHGPASLTPGTEPRYPLDRLSGFQSRSVRGGEERKFHHCPRRKLKPLPPARSLVSLLTEFSRLPRVPENLKNVSVRIWKFL